MHWLRRDRHHQRTPRYRAPRRRCCRLIHSLQEGKSTSLDKSSSRVDRATDACDRYDGEPHRTLYNPTMPGIGEVELDAMRVHEAEISISAELGPVRADGTDISEALAARVDATQLRQYGQQLAANWEVLARFLENLKPRGWRFKGTSGDGVTAYAIIAKQGMPGELHADLSALPADLRDWLANEGR